MAAAGPTGSRARARRIRDLRRRLPGPARSRLPVRHGWSPAATARPAGPAAPAAGGAWPAAGRCGHGRSRADHARFPATARSCWAWRRPVPDWTRMKRLEDAMLQLGAAVRGKRGLRPRRPRAGSNGAGAGAPSPTPAEPGPGGQPRVPAGGTAFRSWSGGEPSAAGRPEGGRLAEVPAPDARLSATDAANARCRQRCVITAPSGPDGENHETMVAETRLGP